MPRAKTKDYPVVLEDGPCKDKPVVYDHPLPGILVVSDGKTWHDYLRTSQFRHYRHSPRCKCYRASGNGGLDAYKL